MPDKKKNIIDTQLGIYRDNFIKHGNNPLGLRWNNQATQFLRFERLIKNLNLSSDIFFSIHDIGAGTCDMHEFLQTKGLDYEYSGTEIVPEMIHAVNLKFPGIKLHNRDILTENIKETYDYVVLSGMFNMPGDITEKEWEKYMFSVIDKMFLMCTKAISFNILTTYKSFTDSSLFYFEPEEVFKYCMKNLSRFVNIDHSYALFEYTVTVFKKDYLKTQYNEQSFEKYFK